MKTKIWYLAISIAMLISGKSFSQTGSLDIDLDLKNIDLEASADFGQFKTEMEATYNISDKKLTELHVGLKMSPADIYMSLECGRLTGKTIDAVLLVYKANREKGWGVISKELGIKPGSKEFHALKANTKARAEKGKQKAKGKGKRNK